MKWEQAMDYSFGMFNFDAFHETVIRYSFDRH